ncbi:MAG: hypothetical protein R2754_03015 [Microthrixaceae bacterium]
MRADNLILVAVCVPAVAVAVVMAWRWRNLDAATARPNDAPTARWCVLDSLRALACVLAAGTASGLLVVGLGGRLVMRILGATSRDPAQGLTTEAGERVGEITMSGTVSFVLFAGLVAPLVAAMLFLLLRRWFPRPAWAAGLTLGVLLAGTLGVAEPLSPENIDFAILAPTWLAVVLVAGTALLFGVAFGALAAKLDATVPPVFQPYESNSQHEAAGPYESVSIATRLPYLSLVVLLNPALAASTIVGLGLRAVSRGRVGKVLDRPEALAIGRAVVAAATVASAAALVNAAATIL